MYLYIGKGMVMVHVIGKKNIMSITLGTVKLFYFISFNHFIKFE